MTRIPATACRTGINVEQTTVRRAEPADTIKCAVRLPTDMSVVPTDEPTEDEHPVEQVEPEMRGSDIRGWQVQLETERTGEWLRWTGPICWIPGEDGGE